MPRLCRLTAQAQIHGAVRAPGYEFTLADDEQGPHRTVSRFVDMPTGRQRMAVDEPLFSVVSGPPLAASAMIPERPASSAPAGPLAAAAPPAPGAFETVRDILGAAADPAEAAARLARLEAATKAHDEAHARAVGIVADADARLSAVELRERNATEWEARIATREDVAVVAARGLAQHAADVEAEITARKAAHDAAMKQREEHLHARESDVAAREGHVEVRENKAAAAERANELALAEINRQCAELEETAQRFREAAQRVR